MLLQVEFTKIDCGVCGGVYALTEKYRERAQQYGTSWNCPYCQIGWGYSGRGEIQKVREERARLERQLTNERARHDQTRADRDHTEARRRAEKAAKTRIKNRIAKGVCPCCNRTFVNLQRHVASQHPEFASQESPRE